MTGLCYELDLTSALERKEGKLGPDRYKHDDGF